MSYRESAPPLDLVFTFYFGMVRAIDLQSGQVRWQWPSPTVNSPVLCARDGRLFHLSAGVLTALDAASGTPMWSVIVPLDLNSRPPRLDVVRDAVLIAHEGVLHAYAALDGASRWRVSTTQFEIPR